MNCQHCGAPTSNGLALCDVAQRWAVDNLPVLQVYIRNLARVRKPSRPNGSLGVAGQWLIKRGETEVDRVGNALELAYNDLESLAKMLHDDRGVELPQGDSDAETAIALCELLEDHVASIATLEWAGEFIRDIERHLNRLADHTVKVVPGWYAGECRRVTGRDMEGGIYICGTPLFVIPGATYLTCQDCGTSSHAADHIDAILEEAGPWVATPKRLAEALVAMLHTEQDVEGLRKRIATWGNRGKFETIQTAEYGLKRHRLSDVLDHLEREAGNVGVDACEAG